MAAAAERARRRARPIAAAAATLVVLAAATGTALASPATAQAADSNGSDEVRIVARKLADGRVEFALRRLLSDGTWTGSLRPRARFFPTTARLDRWLQSSPISLLTTRPASPTPTTSPPGYTAVTVGHDHTCALLVGGIRCWGDNGPGQATTQATTAAVPGTPNPTPVLTPRFVSVTTGGDFAVDRGEDGKVAFLGFSRHSCGLRADRTVICWGEHDWSATEAPSGLFTAVASAGTNSCAIQAVDKAITCWRNGASRPARDVPQGEFTALGAGYSHTCALRTDGTVACWGAGREGQTDAPSGRFVAVTAGDAHSCGLRTDDTVTCWGNNDDGHIDVPTSWTNPQVCRTAPTVMIA